MGVKVKDGRIVDAKGPAAPAKVAAASPCRAPGCERPAVTRGVCGKHYQRGTKPGYPGHAEAAAAILPRSATRPGAGCGQAGASRDHRRVAGLVDALCILAGAIPSGAIEKLMELSAKLGGPEEFERATGVALPRVHAVWRLHLAARGEQEDSEEDHG